MTTDAEKHALAVFVQGIAISVVNLLDREAPEGRTVENFQKALDGYLQVLLDDPTTDASLCGEGVELLRTLFHQEVVRVQEHHAQ